MKKKQKQNEENKAKKEKNHKHFFSFSLPHLVVALRQRGLGLCLGPRSLVRRDALEDPPVCVADPRELQLEGLLPFVDGVEAEGGFFVVDFFIDFFEAKQGEKISKRKKARKK